MLKPWALASCDQDLIMTVSAAMMLLALVPRFLLSVITGFLRVLLLLPLFVLCVLLEPVRMMRLDPVASIRSPPIALVPDVAVVPIAVVLAPIGIVRRPFRMLLPEPHAIVLMPPGVVAPLVIAIVLAPAGTRSRHRNARSDRTPDVGMRDQEFTELRMLLAEARIIDKLGIHAEVASHARMIAQELAEARVIVSRSLRAQVPPHARMIADVFFHLGMVVAPLRIVNLVRVRLQVARDIRMPV